MGQLSSKQKHILVGTLLGDGYLYLNRYGSCCLEIKHADEQKDYVFWLHKNLSNFCPSEPKQRTDNNQWKFMTSSNDDLRYLRKVFYPLHKKIVPDNIGEMLNDPLS